MLSTKHFTRRAPIPKPNPEPEPQFDQTFAQSRSNDPDAEGGRQITTGSSTGSAQIQVEGTTAQVCARVQAIRDPPACPVSERVVDPTPIEAGIDVGWPAGARPRVELRNRF